MQIPHRLMPQAIVPVGNFEYLMVFFYWNWVKLPCHFPLNYAFFYFCWFADSHNKCKDDMNFLGISLTEFKREPVVDFLPSIPRASSGRGGRVDWFLWLSAAGFLSLRLSTHNSTVPTDPFLNPTTAQDIQYYISYQVRPASGHNHQSKY